MSVPSSDRMVLIIVDTLRADRLGCYGFGEPTTPAMDRLAEAGVIFEKMHSASPWTAPSFGSIFTGVSPTVHGAGALLAKGNKKGTKLHGVTVGGIREALPTLAGLMPEKIRTAAFMTNAFLSKELGMDRGFDHYDHQNAGNTHYRKADEVTDRAIAWIEENKDKPFFLLVHYFDPHMSYGPPEKYLSMFAPNKPRRISVPFTDHNSARDGTLDPSDAEKKFINGLYNGEVRFVDDQIGRIVEVMKKHELLDYAWTVVTSDHGEEIFDHGSFDHGHRYEEEVTRVPFILRAPEGKWKAGDRISTSVRHVDIAPTLLSLFGQSPPPHFEGKSLLPIIEGKDKADRPAYIEFNLFNGQQCALFDGRRKIVWDLRRKRGFFYDLKTDPGEKTKLQSSNPAYKPLFDQLKAVRRNLAKAAKGKVANKAALSEEAGQALKSLGYIE